MDKHEYKLRSDEIGLLIQEKRYKEAMEIADTIDWKGIKRARTLCTISDLYKINKRYKDALEILQLAYDINPNSRMILYSLCELSLKVNDIVNAIEYCKEFQSVAPSDSGRYILQYKIYSTIGNSLEERIGVLEELQRYDFKEKWMYELAKLYHSAGEGAKCVEQCNQVVIYFGEGKYVIKALELMSLHTPLSPDYEALYNRLTNPMDDIEVSSIDVGKYNPDDLQKELASNLQEILTSESTSEPEIQLSETTYSETYEQAVSSSEATEQAAPGYYESEVSEPEDRIYEAPVRETPVKENEAPEYDESLFNTTVYRPVTVDIPLEDEATKIMDVRAINRALEKEEPVKEYKTEPVHEEPRKEAVRITPPSDTGFKGTVIEPGKPWDMHEIDLGASANSAIKYPNYDDMVSVEGDGQLSIVMPEQEPVDKQITGQISIDDILLEWERMKNENDRKWQEGIKQSVKSKTDDMFANFEREAQNGLLEELEISLANGEKKTVSVEEQKEILLGNREEEQEYPESEEIYEEIIILEDDFTVAAGDADGTGTSESLETSIDETGSEPVSEDKEADSEAVVTEAQTSENVSGNGDISEIFYSEDAVYIDGVGAVTSGENAEVAETESETVDVNPNDVYTGEEEEGPSMEELIFDRTPFLSDKQEEDKEDKETDPVSDDTDVLPNLEELDYFMKFAASIEEKEIADKAIFGAAQMMVNGLDEPGDIFKNDDAAEEDITLAADNKDTEDITESESESESEIIAESESEPDGVQDLFAEEKETTESENIIESEVNSESEEIRVTEEISESEESSQSDSATESEVISESESMSGSDEITESEAVSESESESETIAESEVEFDGVADLFADEISEDTSTSEDSSDEISESEVTDSEGEEADETEPSDTIDEFEEDQNTKEGEDDGEPGESQKVSDNVLTEAQLERYENFIQGEGTAEQIAAAFSKVSMDASHGNIFIGSEDIDSAVELSKAIVQELNESELIYGKVGKTKGTSLNNKDIIETCEKFEGGALIIQDAGELTPETINKLDECISDPDLKLLIILTANYRAKHKFIMNNSEFMKHFDISIDIISLDDRELADYGVEYAKGLEYSIDEVALLALHRKIEELQTNAHAVTVSEVRDIIDEAIAKANKKTPGHFFDVLFGNRYDEDDMIILRENDFE